MGAIFCRAREATGVRRSEPWGKEGRRQAAGEGAQVAGSRCLSPAAGQSLGGRKWRRRCLLWG